MHPIHDVAVGSADPSRPDEMPMIRYPLAFLLLLLVGCSQPPAADPPAQALPHVHDTADETCFICDPDKRDPGRLWCRAHARYEDRCWLCQPQLREAGRPYCEEHGLYEDECFLCDPARGVGAAVGDEHDHGHGSESAGEAEAGAGSEAGAAQELWCEEHQVPERECGICQPQFATELPPGGALLVRLPSERSADLVGLAIGTPTRSEGSTSLSLLGEVRYDGNRLARVTPLSDGVVIEVRVDVGDDVRPGQVLAVVNAPAVAEARARYVSALHAEQLTSAALRRKELLEQEQIGSQRALEEARAEHGSAVVAASLARQGLLNLGFRESELGDVGDSGSSALYLRAPFGGTVVHRAAVLGAAVSSGEALFEVADLGQMWVELAVPEESAAALQVGTPVEVTVRTLRGQALAGVVSWIGPVVDERTRLVRARAVLDNPGGVLRQGMFADVTAIVEALPDAVRLPSSAVHQLSELPFVFVQQEADLFAARRVELGVRLPSDEFVIRAGIGPEDAVVMTGGFSLKSALLASRLGAGCAHE